MMRSKSSSLQLLFLALVSSPLGSHAQHQHDFLRGLKGGGKGGGGGGGSRGGGGSSYNSSSGSRNSCKGETCGNTATIVAGVALAVGALVGVLCFWRYKKRQANHDEAAASLPKSAASSSKHQSFDDRVTTARSEQAASFSGFRSHDPKSGTYLYNYKENRKTKEGTVQLYFTEDNGRYKLSGSTTDDDGVATIDEGFASYDGNAWWKETNVTGESGLQVLNKGKFDFSNSTFEGEWWAKTTGLSGTFVSFVLEQEEAEVTNISSSPLETAVRVKEVPFSTALGQ